MGLPSNASATARKRIGFIGFWLEPYWALAEELDIPVGIHMGPVPPEAAYVGFPEYRMRLGNPLLLEDVLVGHPKLPVYICHAVGPFLNELLGLLYPHPQV